MRLSGPEPIAAALEAGITIFDTAHAYGVAPGDNEPLLAGALKKHPDAFIISKGSMTRPNGGWRADGRAQTLPPPRSNPVQAPRKHSDAPEHGGGDRRPIRRGLTQVFEPGINRFLAAADPRVLFGQIRQGGTVRASHSPM